MKIDDAMTEFEERLRVAQLNSDVDELALLLDDNLMFSAINGEIISKKDDITLHKSPGFEITKMDLIDRKIQPFEGVAVVNTLMHVTATIDGNIQSDKLRYIRVWHEFSDGWRIIAGSMHIEVA